MTATRVIRPAFTPAPVVAEPEGFWRECGAGHVYSGGRPDPVIFAAWERAHRTCEDGHDETGAK